MAFFTGAFKKNWREFLWMIAAVALIMLIREQNNWFKTNMFKGAWQLGVLCVLVPIGYWLLALPPLG